MKKPKWNIAASFKTRAFRVGGYSVAMTGIVLAIAVIVNVIVGALPAAWTQFDTTSNQMVTLSEQTESIVGGLDQEITVYWVVQSGNEDSNVQTLLERCSALSSNLKIVKKDPDVYPTFLEGYEVESVYNNSLIVESGTRYRYVDYYEIYTYDYSNYYYTGSYDVSFSGEQALTSAIDYCISEDLPKLYLLTGHGEAELATTFSDAVAKENVETEALSLVSMEAVPEDADCVMIYSPQSDIAEEELEILRTYLSGGGQLLLITDPLQDGKLTNLEALMADYGVTAEEGVVIEGSQSHYAWGTPYYLLPSIASHTITSPLVNGGYYVLLPIAQGLTVSEELPENVTVTKLLTTSDDAFSKVAGYSLTTYDKEEGDIEGPFALAVAVSDSGTGANIVWVSSGALLDETTNTRISGGNQDMFLNALGYLCGEDESSISIRAKSLSYEYLTMDSGTVTTLTILVVGVIPLAYLLVGVVIRIRRKHR